MFLLQTKDIIFYWNLEKLQAFKKNKKAKENI